MQQIANFDAQCQVRAPVGGDAAEEASRTAGASAARAPATETTEAAGTTASASPISARYAIGGARGGFAEAPGAAGAHVDREAAEAFAVVARNDCLIGQRLGIEEAVRRVEDQTG